MDGGVVMFITEKNKKIKKKMKEKKKESHSLSHKLNITNEFIDKFN
jgi:hypothetical protein